jgi:hypothetical protein
LSTRYLTKVCKGKSSDGISDVHPTAYFRVVKYFTTRIIKSPQLLIQNSIIMKKKALIFIGLCALGLCIWEAQAVNSVSTPVNKLMGKSYIVQNPYVQDERPVSWLITPLTPVQNLICHSLTVQYGQFSNGYPGPNPN